MTHEDHSEGLWGRGREGREGGRERERERRERERGREGGRVEIEIKWSDISTTRTQIV